MHEFNFVLDDNEQDFLKFAFLTYFRNNQKIIREALLNPNFRSVYEVSGEVGYAVADSEKLISITKKMGVDLNLDCELARMQEIRSLTIVEPDTRSSAESLNQEASAG